MTDIGLLPEAWEVASLSKIATINKSSMDPRSYPTESFEYYSIPAYQISNDPIIENGSNIHSQKLVINTGTVLFGKLNPRVPKVWLVESLSDKRKLASTEFIPLTPIKDLIISGFLYYLAWSNYVMPKAKELVSGSTPSRQRVDTAAFGRIPIPLPPLPEQKAIARVLSTIQQAIEAQDKIIVAAREMKKSLMKHLFTYGPVPVAEAERVPLKETEIGLVPEEWEIARLGDLFEIKQGKALSPQHRRGISPRLFLRTANVFWGRLDLANLDSMDFTDSEVSQLRLMPNDLLVCEGGDIGRTAIWRGELDVCCYQNHLHRLRAVRDVFYPLFYMYWMQAAYLLFGLYGGTGNKTTIPNLSQSRLKSFVLPLPPLPEQQQIASILSAVDQKIETAQNRKASLQTLFQTMLHLLMTGKIRVKGLEVPAL